MSMDPDFRQDDGEGGNWTIQQVSVLQIKISSHVTLNMPFSLLDKFKPDSSGSSPRMTGFDFFCHRGFDPGSQFSRATGYKKPPQSSPVFLPCTSSLTVKRSS